MYLVYSMYFRTYVTQSSYYLAIPNKIHYWLTCHVYFSQNIFCTLTHLISITLQYKLPMCLIISLLATEKTIQSTFVFITMNIRFTFLYCKFSFNTGMAGVSRVGDIERRRIASGFVHSERKMEERASTEKIESPRRPSSTVPTIRWKSAEVRKITLQLFLVSL